MSSSRRKVARERLEEKVLGVRDAQSRLKVHYTNLDVFVKHTDETLSQFGEAIEKWFDEVKESVEKERSHFLAKFGKISKAKEAMVNLKREIIDNAIQECSNSIVTTNSLMEENEQSVIIQQYVNLAQELEGSLINALTLLDDTSLPSLEKLISTLSNTELSSNTELVLVNPLDDHITSIHSFIDGIMYEDLTHHQSSAANNTSHSLNVNSSPLLDRSVDESHETASNKAEISVPNLYLPCDSFINIVVVSIPSVTSFIVQPYTEKLVELSMDLRDYALQLQEGVSNDQFFSSLQVGQFCCARFSVDQCWYRAKIINHEPLFRSATVLFIDYGNKETLPFSCLLPLTSSLATLPSQALNFTLSNVTIPPLANVSSIHMWMESILIGNVAQAQVICCGTENNMDVKLFVPTDIVLSVESTTILHQSAGVVDMSKLFDATKSTVDIGSLLVSLLNKDGSSSTGDNLAKPVALKGHNLCSNSTQSLVVTSQISKNRFPNLNDNLQSTTKSINEESFKEENIIPIKQDCSITDDLLVPLQDDDQCSFQSAGSIEEVVIIPPPSDFCCQSEEATELETRDQTVAEVTQNVSLVVEDNNCDSPDNTATEVCPSTADEKELSNDKISTETILEVAESESTISKIPEHQIEAVSTVFPPSSIDINTQFILIVSHIVTPSCFYVFPGENANTLHILETELNHHYSDESHCKILQDVTKDSICCIKCCDIIEESSDPVVVVCRGIVQSLEQSSASVLCFDYGIVRDVQMNELFVLEPWFFEMPIQCICCSLEGIAPVHSSTFENTDRDQATPQDEVDLQEKETVCENKEATLQDEIDLQEKETVCENEEATLQDEIDLQEKETVCENKDKDQAITEDEIEKVTVHENKDKDQEEVDPQESERVQDASQKSLDDNRWSKESIFLLHSLVNDKLLVGIVKEKKDIDSFYCHQYSILLYDTNKSNDCFFVNVALVDKGVATSISNDTLVDNQLMEDVLKNWNPMQSDYLSQRNVYEVDDEDVSSALLGYGSSNQKVCRYYNTLEGCYEGDKCRFQHLPDGVYDELLQETYTSPSLSSLPSVGSMILVVVTAIQSPTSFMIHLMGPAELLMKDTVAHTKFIKSKFMTLMREMDRHYRESTGRSMKHFVPPNNGELVAVWCEHDGHWYRAITKDQHNNEIHVFYIDVGYEEWVGQELIREIAPEFVHLPVQAIECRLVGMSIEKEKVLLSKTVFEEMVRDKVMFAEVKWKNESGILGLELYSLPNDDLQLKDEQEQNSLNQKMLKLRLALPNEVKTNKSSTLKKEPIMFIPG